MVADDGLEALDHGQRILQQVALQCRQAGGIDLGIYLLAEFLCLQTVSQSQFEQEGQGFGRVVRQFAVEAGGPPPRGPAGGGARPGDR